MPSRPRTGRGKGRDRATTPRGSPMKRERLSSPAAVMTAVLTAIALAVLTLPTGPTAAEAKPSPPKGAVLTFDPTSHDFYRVGLGNSLEKEFTLANTGRKGVGRLRLRVVGSADFSVA